MFLITIIKRSGLIYIYNMVDNIMPDLGNGYITTEVLREILEELDDNLTAEDLDNMIEEIDADGSGTVDWDGKRNAKIFPVYYLFI